MRRLVIDALTYRGVWARADRYIAVDRFNAADLARSRCEGEARSYVAIDEPSLECDVFGASSELSAARLSAGPVLAGVALADRDYVENLVRDEVIWRADLREAAAEVEAELDAAGDADLDW